MTYQFQTVLCPFMHVCAKILWFVLPAAKILRQQPFHNTGILEAVVQKYLRLQAAWFSVYVFDLRIHLVETIDLLVRCHSILFHYVLPSEVEQMFNVLVLALAPMTLLMIPHICRCATEPRVLNVCNGPANENIVQ